jgi:protein SCO1
MTGLPPPVPQGRDSSPGTGAAPRGRWLGWLIGVLGSWRFPVFALSLLVGFTLVMLGLLFVPPSASGLGAFAEEFRIWCFGYDPATGKLEWSYVWTTALQPLLMGSVILFVWWRPLAEGLRHHRAGMSRWCALTLTGVVGMTVAFGLLDRAESGDELPFPAEQLRTAHLPPELSLINQDGDLVTLSALRGKVVMVTAVYATCSHTCPMIMAQTRRVVDGLSPEQREDLRVVAITLDPERDDQELLARVAAAQQIAAPLYNLVTGEPDEVNRMLDAFQVARRRNPDNGMIDHANLFLLIDREGRLAYRLSLGDRQERWLAVALGLLLDER